MTSLSLDNLISNKAQSHYVHAAFVELQKKSFDRAEAILNEGIRALQAARDLSDEDTALLAVLYSSLGVLYKIKRDFREAWRYYDQAENLLPDNPVLKLISARLLIEVFSQNDIAIRKIKKVEDICLKDPLLSHHMHATYGLAYARQGNKQLTETELNHLLDLGFENMVSAGNLDFKLVEACVRKNWHRASCDSYLARALAFAKKTGEDAYIRLFERLLKASQTEQTQLI